MAEDPRFEKHFEDPFENRVIQDPFEEQHFNSNNSSTYNASQSGSNWAETLPDSTAVLVLGILSIIAGFCYGIVGLIFGIIALAIASRPERLYREQPNRYSQSSYGNLRAGRICAIIGLCISGLIVLIFVAMFAFLGFS